MGKIGEDIEFLKDRRLVRFFDVDGVLCVYAFGEKGVNACSDDKWEEYLENNDPYRSIITPDFMRDYLWTYTNIAHNYVVTHIGSIREFELKKNMILSNYGEHFYPSQIYGVMDGDSKNKVIKTVLKTKYDGLSHKHCLIDDTVSVLSGAQEGGITAIHISSLFLLAQLKRN